MYIWYNYALDWRMMAARYASRKQVPERTTWRSPQPATRTRTGDPTRTVNTSRTMTRTTTRRRKTGSTSTSGCYTTNTEPRMSRMIKEIFSISFWNFCETRLLFGEVWFWNEDQHEDTSWSERRGKVCWASSSLEVVNFSDISVIKMCIIWSEVILIDPHLWIIQVKKEQVSISPGGINVKKFGQSDQIYSWETWTLNCSADYVFKSSAKCVADFEELID